jgi:OOP family OmpA-OmpF porin
MIRREAVSMTETLSAPPAGEGSSASELERVRQLLLGEEYERVLALRRRLDDPEAYTRSVADVLPAAVLERARRDESLTQALMPSVESALKVSVQRNPRPLVDALFPVIGPAIRKSITEALRQTLDSLNELVEQRASLRAVKWRVDSWRTGKSFAEIALLHSYTYHVEQVFLIHRETGLLLRHLQSSRAIVQDPDMVSGMLSAIQDFLTDSFEVEPDGALHSMRLGDLSVVVERGPLAVVAAVVRGHPNAELATTLLETLEEVHLRFGRELRDYDGDTDSLAETQPLLTRCLRSQRAEGASGSRWRRRVLAALILLAVALPLGYAWQSARQERDAWAAVVDRLRAEPGMVVLSAGPDGDRYAVSLLRDPLAGEPEAIVSGLVPTGREILWTERPYVALDAPIVLARAERSLNPPAGVRIVLEGETLRLSGEAGREWLESLNARALAIPGVVALDRSELVVSDPRRTELGERIGAIESTVLDFGRAESELAAAQAEVLPALAVHVRRLQALAFELERPLWVRVVGHTDSAGDEADNLDLSRSRAASVVEALVALGLPRGVFLVEGVGAAEPRVDDPEAPANRRVEFRVDGLDESGAGASGP